MPEQTISDLKAALVAANNSRREWETVALKWREQRDELQQTLDLIRQSDMRAIKMWQQETGQDMSWPDRGKMIFWLLKKLEKNNGTARADVPGVPTAGTGDQPNRTDS